MSNAKRADKKAVTNGELGFLSFSEECRRAQPSMELKGEGGFEAGKHAQFFPTQRVRWSTGEADRPFGDVFETYYNDPVILLVATGDDIEGAEINKDGRFLSRTLVDDTDVVESSRYLFTGRHREVETEGGAAVDAMEFVHELYAGLYFADTLPEGVQAHEDGETFLDAIKGGGDKKEKKYGFLSFSADCERGMISLEMAEAFDIQPGEDYVVLRRPEPIHAGRDDRPFGDWYDERYSDPSVIWVEVYSEEVENGTRIYDARSFMARRLVEEVDAVEKSRYYVTDEIDKTHGNGAKIVLEAVHETLRSLYHHPDTAAAAVKAAAGKEETAPDIEEVEDGEETATGEGRRGFDDLRIEDQQQVEKAAYNALDIASKRALLRGGEEAEAARIQFRRNKQRIASGR
jgi:hypothetical protein